MSDPIPCPSEAPLTPIWVFQSRFLTGELPWAGKEGPEVKAKLEAGESPALNPLVPTPYQALVWAGLGRGPADRWGSLQNTRYLLREAMAQVHDRLAGVSGSHGISDRAHIQSPFHRTRLPTVPHQVRGQGGVVASAGHNSAVPSHSNQMVCPSRDTVL